jgi:Plant specific mitochondrial import receptor subunit TOM20
MFSAIHVLRFAIVTVFAFTSLRAAEPTKSATSAPVVVTMTAPKAATPETYEIINLRKQADDSARDRAIAEAALEVISAGNSRMEIYVGMIGILVTLLVAAFGLFTYRTAALAATKATEDEFKSAREKIAALLEAAEEITGKITQTHDEALALSESLQAEINRLPNSEQTPQIDEAGQVELTKAATVVSEKPLKERTAQDFRILMYEAAQTANWQDYFKLAEAMAILHSENPEDLAFALFGKAYAANKLDDHMMAARLYEDYLTRCSNDIPSDRAIALSNWGAALTLQAKIRQGDEADALFTDASRKYSAAVAINPNMHGAFSNWGAALSAHAQIKQGSDADMLFAKAGEKYAAALAIKPDMHEAYFGWGSALSEQAKTKDGDEADQLYAQAYAKYDAVLAIKRDDHEALCNWGNAFLYQASSKTSAIADELYEKAYSKYGEALAFQPSDHQILWNWGAALWYQAKTKQGAEADALFAQAEEKLRVSEQLMPGFRAYNLSCLFAVRGDAGKAAEWLIVSRAKGVNFPGCAHLAADSDFDAVRDAPEFKAALAQIGC